MFQPIDICSGLVDVSAEVSPVYLCVFLFLKRLSVVMRKHRCLEACERPNFTDFKDWTLRCFSLLQFLHS